MKKNILKNGIFTSFLLSIALVVTGCSNVPQISQIKNDITFDNPTGAVIWNTPGQKFEFVLGKNFKYNSAKSDADTNDVKGEFNTRIIYAEAEIGKASLSFRADYQDDSNRSLTRIAELKAEKDMHKVFGLGSSQKIADQGNFTSDNILYAAWAKTYPMPKNEKIVSVNLYVLTTKGHVSFTFETSDGFNFSKEFIQQFIKSIKVEV